MGFITREQLVKLSGFLGKSGYGEYLLRLTDSEFLSLKRPAHEFSDSYLNCLISVRCLCLQKLFSARGAPNGCAYF